MSVDITSLIGGSIIDGVSKIISLFKVPPEKQLEAQTELAKIQLELQGKLLDQVQGQLDINKAEAASSNWFVAGWRPFIGWVCGLAFAYAFVVQPFLLFGLAAYGKTVVPPNLDLSTMMPVLLGMLGLAGMRTYEKVSNLPGTKNLQ